MFRRVREYIFCRKGKNSLRESRKSQEASVGPNEGPRLAMDPQGVSSCLVHYDTELRNREDDPQKWTFIVPKFIFAPQN